MKGRNIAIMLVGVTSHKCGGAERFFSDFFEKYSSGEKPKNNLYFFCDSSTLSALKRINKLRSSDNIVLLRNESNRFKKFIENIDLLWKVLTRRISILHIANYTPDYFDRLKFVSGLPGFIRPRIVINIVDCEIPYVLGDSDNPRHESYRKRYVPLFRELKVDAYYSWYRLFGEFVKSHKWLNTEVPVVSVNSRFADIAGFKPAEKKENIIVFAARLTQQKRPLLFIDAIAELRRFCDLDKSGWRFEIYGDGPEREAVLHSIESYGLSAAVTLHDMTDLRPVFAVTKCFVSTQDYENFPSLSMSEAMAAGNAIVARNVGQTNLFVEDHTNGYLTDDTAEDIARCLFKIISEPQGTARMGIESSRLSRTVHSPENFIRDIDRFWSTLITG